MATTREKSRRRPGRPSRQEELARTLAELGVDPALLSPKRILAAIAADADAPASARVAACKVLLGQEPTEVEQPAKAEARPTTKKAAEAKAAASAGQGSEWGRDLDWPGRSQ